MSIVAGLLFFFGLKIVAYGAWLRVAMVHGGRETWTNGHVAAFAVLRVILGVIVARLALAAFEALGFPVAGRIPIPTILPGGGGTLDYLVVFAPLRLLVWTPFLAVAPKRLLVLGPHSRGWSSRRRFRSQRTSLAASSECPSWEAFARF